MSGEKRQRIMSLTQAVNDFLQKREDVLAESKEELTDDVLHHDNELCAAYATLKSVFEPKDKDTRDKLRRSAVRQWIQENKNTYFAFICNRLDFVPDSCGYAILEAGMPMDLVIQGTVEKDSVETNKEFYVDKDLVMYSSFEGKKKDAPIAYLNQVTYKKSPSYDALSLSHGWELTKKFLLDQGISDYALDWLKKAFKDLRCIGNGRTMPGDLTEIMPKLLHEQEFILSCICEKLLECVGLEECRHMCIPNEMSLQKIKEARKYPLLIDYKERDTSCPE